MRIHIVLWALLVFCLIQAADAQQLFVRNKPFKGTVVGKSDSMRVELEPICQALGLELTARGEGWVAAPGSEETPPAGTVLVNGQSLPLDEQKLVNLKDFCRAAGARVVPNPSLGTVDVYLATTINGGDDFSNVPTAVNKDATPTQVVRAYFGAFRLLDALPPAGDGEALVSFMRDPGRFMRSMEMCTNTIKPLVTAEFFQSWNERVAKMRKTLADGPRIFHRMKASDRAEAARELGSDPEFKKFWGTVTRLWDGLRYSKVKIMSESVTGNEAAVDVEITLGSLGTAVGKIDLIRQDGRWKIKRAPRAPGDSSGQ